MILNLLFKNKAFGVKDYTYKEHPQATSYIGKEKYTESNLGDHGVRKYDSDLGRFLCPDAMWEKYISYTPYQYSLNNPISNIDWDGKDASDILYKNE